VPLQQKKYPMFHEQISVLLPFLLIGAIIIAIGALIFGKIIVKFNLFLLIGEIGEILSNPIQSVKGIWRFIIQSILSRLFNRSVKVYFDEVDSTSYFDLFFLFLGISILIFFQAFSIANIAAIAEILAPYIIEITGVFIPLVVYNVFLVIKFIKRFFAAHAKQFKILLIFSFCLLLFFILFEPSTESIAILLEAIAIIGILWIALLKIIVVKRIKTFIKKAKRIERTAKRLDKKDSVQDALAQYYWALKIYQLPVIIKNAKFDLDRAQLLKHMSVLFNKNNQLKKALSYCDQALNIYQKLEIVEDSVHMEEMTGLLKKSAEILCQMGEREAALERYKLIYELTGMAIPKEFFTEKWFCQSKKRRFSEFCKSLIKEN
jgi:tetratricopeptide (TPR) repeat protein